VGHPAPGKVRPIPLPVTFLFLPHYLLNWFAFLISLDHLLVFFRRANRTQRRFVCKSLLRRRAIRRLTTMGLTGSQKFAVFLCKFSDNSNVEPFTPDFYRQLIAERGTGGLNDYWIAASQGAINLDGSDIFGWRTIQQKQADFLAARPGRWDKILGAMAAFPEVDTSKYKGVIAMYNTDVGDGGNANNGVLASPTGMSVTTKPAMSSAWNIPLINPLARMLPGRHQANTTTCTTS
jgi:hypothetical protein